jgi:UDP-N-acetylmuramoyl-L-alanyl-D-glutamate--2,6-diaminopimelate ligase
MVAGSAIGSVSSPPVRLGPAGRGSPYITGWTSDSGPGTGPAGNSDLQIVTSDNPRNEDPAEIIAAIVEGMPEDSGNYSTVPDRRAAIGAAIREARAGDTVVIAGKGHEDYQWAGTRRLPFDDRVVAGEWLDETDARRDR